MDGNGGPDMLALEVSSASPGAEAEARAAAAADLYETSPARREEKGETAGTEEAKRWPGWPGDNVFRVIVPVVKVGSIIGRKGELIKKLCEETRARVRILEGAIGTSDRIVLISGREEPDAAVSPAMSAVLRVFKRINGISESEDGTVAVPPGSTVCSVRLVAAYSQAINLIGKGGTLIKAIQEGSGAIIRVLSAEEMPFYATSDERIIEIQGDPLKVIKALEGVVGHLRKFLVDHSVLPLFEKAYSSSVSSVPQDRAANAWAEKTPSFMQTSQTRISGDYPLQLKRDSLFLDREPRVDSQIHHSGLSLYGQDPAIAGSRSLELRRPMGALITQITQTMQIPLSHAEDIIGIDGKNIAYVRRTSGAVITLQETSDLPNELTVEIKGTTDQVQTAQELIHELISGHTQPVASSYSSGYGVDTGLRSTYSQLPSATYPNSLSRSQSYSGYGASGVSGYGRFRF